MRIIALDVHRSFAQTAILENGKLRDAGKIDLEYSRLLRFARKLKPDDEIVIEATGNTSAIVRVLLPFVGRVVIANPILVRAIAWAKVKTDKIDAAVLAKLHASGFLPEVWMPDEETEARRHVAAVATARKLAVIIWHILSKDEDYTWNRPALLQWKLRKLELKAGHPSRRGGRQKGSAAAYSNKSVRDSERETIANAEDEYRRFVATWKQQSPKERSGATNEVRRS